MLGACVFAYLSGTRKSFFILRLSLFYQDKNFTYLFYKTLL